MLDLDIRARVLLNRLGLHPDPTCGHCHRLLAEAKESLRAVVCAAVETAREDLPRDADPANAARLDAVSAQVGA